MVIWRCHRWILICLVFVSIFIQCFMMAQQSLHAIDGNAHRRCWRWLLSSLVCSRITGLPWASKSISCSVGIYVSLSQLMIHQFYCGIYGLWKQTIYLTAQSLKLYVRTLLHVSAEQKKSLFLVCIFSISFMTATDDDDVFRIKEIVSKICVSTTAVNVLGFLSYIVKGRCRLLWKTIGVKRKYLFRIYIQRQ